MSQSATKVLPRKSRKRKLCDGSRSRPRTRAKTEVRALEELKHFVLFPNCVPTHDSEEFIRQVQTYFPPERAVGRAYGKTYKVPRDQVVMGDVAYSYSGQTVETIAMSPVVRRIQAYVESLWHSHTGKRVRFTYCLINGYNPADKVAKHQDNEPDIDQTEPIASVSFGTSRPFDVWLADAKHKAISGTKWRQVLNHRDVCFMLPGAQEKYLHEVPPCKSAKGPAFHDRRYNITFRCNKA